MTANFIPIKLSITRCYLLKAQGGYLLIDTGLSDELSLFEKKLHQQGISYKDIRYIFLTHHHHDHSGLLNFISLHNESIQVIMHHKSLELLSHGENYLAKSGYVGGMVRLASSLYRMFTKNTSSFPPFFKRTQDVIVYADDREFLRSIGINGQIMYTPGHTQDSMSLILDSGAAFVGDAAANIFNFIGAKHCPPVAENMKQLYQSWQNILDTGATKIYPSHGRFFKAKKLQDNSGKIKQSKLIPCRKRR